MNECQKYYIQAGAERFFAKAINLNVHRRTDGKKVEDLSHWLPKKSMTTLYKKEGERVHFRVKESPCTICLTPIIRCDGEILMCCHDIFNNVMIGNVFEKEFGELWFSKRYKHLRNLAKHRKLPICHQCGK